MELTQEQSTSPLPSTEPESLPDNSQSQPEPESPSEPQPDLSQEASSEVPQLEQPQLPELDQQPEPQDPSSEQPQEQPQEEQEATEPKTYESWEEVDLSNLSEEARTEIEPILNLVLETQTELDEQINQYKELSEHFTTLIEGLDAAKKGDMQPLINEYNSLNESFDLMSTENVELCHRLFMIEFPEYDTQNDAVKAAFIEAMQHDGFHSRYIGDSLYDKMVDAYKLAIYRHGGSAPASRSTPQPAQAAAPVRQPNPSAAKQALVSGGEMAPNMPVTNVSEMSFDDILSRGEYLLDM